MRPRAVAGGLALAATAGWNVSNVGAVADQLSQAYGVSLAVIGLFTTGLFVTHAALQVPGGRFCDRLGARPVGLAGLAIAAAASALALTWREAAFAIAMRVLTGVGTGLSFVAGSDYVRATIGTAVAQGVYGAGSMTAGGLALAIVPLVGGWQAPFTTALVVACVGLAALLAAPPARARQSRARGPATVVDRRLLPLGAMHSASFGLSVVIGNWVVTLLERHGALSASVSGAAGALTLLLGIVTRPLGGRFYGRAGPLRASFLVGAAATAVLALSASLPVAIVASALVGLAAGLPFAPAFTGAARARPDAPGAAVGFVNTLGAVTILVFTPLVGLTFSLPGEGRLGFLVVAALWGATAAAVPSGPVREPARAAGAGEGRA